MHVELGKNRFKIEEDFDVEDGGEDQRPGMRRGKKVTWGSPTEMKI